MRVNLLIKTSEFVQWWQ